MRTGEFSTSFAKRKRWKLDDRLFDALLATISKGSSIVDIGAGVGRYVAALRNLDRYPSVEGFDGIVGIEELSEWRVQYKNFAYSSVRDSIRHGWDWAICIEVGEHIPKKFETPFLDNLSVCFRRGLVLSWGIPGQKGKDHVNCRMPEYVTYEMAVRGVKFCEEKTLVARAIAGKGWDKKLLVFEIE